MRRVALATLCGVLWGCSSSPSESLPEGAGQQEQMLTPSTFALVKDINPNASGPSPASFLECNGWIYFSAKHPQGSALYRVDSAGNVSPAIASFPETYPPTPLACFRPVGAPQDMLLFSGGDDATGAELWLSDGTQAGTRQVADVNQGPSSSIPSAVGTLGGRFFFLASRGSDRQLWQTDGTTAGTSRVTSQIIRGTPVILGAKILFANESSTNSELWVSDGSRSGTVLLKDLNPGGSSSPAALTVAGARAFFVANDGVHGTELWTTDGTAAGTSLVKDVRPGADSAIPLLPTQKIASAGSTVFFGANDGPHGEELWKSDGTAAGTVLVKDANPGTASSAPQRMVFASGKVFYIARLDATGFEPWVSDGTESGTLPLRDIQPGTNGSVSGRFAPLGSGVIFFADDGVHGYELWTSNGTPAGTQMVVDLYPGPRAGSDLPNATVAAGRTYFTCTTPLGINDLCISNGTAAGTQRLAMAGLGTGSSSPTGLAVLNGSAFFIANDGTTGRELYVTDGTSDGTLRLTDIDPGALDGVRGNPIAVTSRVFFTGHTSAQGTELWATDGTPTGTYLVKDINPTPGAGAFDGTAPTDWGVALGNTLYFVVNDGSTGYELWRSDGTSSGTVEVADLAPGAAQGATRVLPQGVNNAVLFQGYNASGSLALYSVTNGAAPVRISPDNLYVSRTAISGNKVYFIGYSSVSTNTPPAGVWSTDGTATGTQLVAGGSFSDLVVAGTQIVMANAGALYVSDGTVGNRRILSLAGTYNYTNGPSGLVSLGNQIAFVGGNGTMGFGLWVSDLTRAGTTRLLDLPPDMTSWIQRDGGRVYFSSDTTGHGRELWYTNLTASGTVLPYEFAPGLAHSTPTGLTRLNSHQLLLSANDGVHGVELWRIDEVSL